MGVPTGPYRGESSGCPQPAQNAGWITAASAAAARAKDDAAQAAAAVAAVKATNDTARCAALAAVPVDANTHYRETNDVIHALPRAADRFAI